MARLWATMKQKAGSDNVAYPKHNPFRSKAQMRKFYAMEERGEIPRGTTEKWKEHTPSIKRLPERKHRKGPSKVSARRG